jgi:hypothetical protein
MRLIALASLVLCTGCAAIFGSKQKNFDLRSHPDGAEVYLDGARLGTTPFKVNLSNQKEHTFVFRMAGYKETQCTLARGTGGGWVIADILMGLVPVIIDAATNSWSQTKGNGCLGQLEPIAGPVPTAAVAIAPAPASAVAPARAPATVPVSEQVVAPPAVPPAPMPEVPVDPRVPPLANFVASISTRWYYPVTCAIWVTQVPPEDRFYYRTERAAEADGYVHTRQCQ